MNRTASTRRRVLRAAGTVVATAPLAGCGGPGEDQNGADEGSGENDENGDTPEQGEGAPDAGSQEDD